MSSDELPEAVAPEAPAAVPAAAPSPPASERDDITLLRQHLRKTERPWHLGIRTLIFAVSLGAFIWTMRDNGPLGIGVIVGVLLLHELGHFAAMKAFGYRDMKMFFIPFFGAAVSGKPSNPNGWQAGVVSLAGPVPGLVLGAALLPFVGESRWQAVAVISLVFVNGLNLLPFVPLDGGRLLGTVLFSRHVALEMLAAIAGAIGLVVYVFDVSGGGMAFAIGAMSSLMINRLQFLNALGPLRAAPLDLSGRTSELPEASLVALSTAAAKAQVGGGFLTVNSRASMVAALHEAAQLKPAPWKQSLVLFAAWAAAGWLALSTTEEIKNPSTRWRAVEAPDGLWTAQFPCRPTMARLPAPPGVTSLDQATCAIRSKGEFAVITGRLPVDFNHFDLDVDAAKAGMTGWVDESARLAKATIRRQTFITWQDHLTLETELDSPTSGPMVLRHIAFGDSIVVLVTANVKDDVLRRQFQDGVRLQARR